MGMAEDAFDHDQVTMLRLDRHVADWRDVLRRLHVTTWVADGRHSADYDSGVIEWFARDVP